MSIESEIKRLEEISISQFTIYWIYGEDGEQLTTAYSLEEVKEILREQRTLGFKCRVDRLTKNFSVG